jgi:hypothetical protein
MDDSVLVQEAQSYQDFPNNQANMILLQRLGPGLRYKYTGQA